NYPGNFAVFADFHKFTRLGAVLVGVVKHETGKPPHDVDQVELELWIKLESLLEVCTQSRLASNRARRIVQQLGGDGRHQHDVFAVVIHDGVKVVRVPGLNPMPSEALDFVFGEHDESYKRKLRTEN